MIWKDRTHQGDSSLLDNFSYPAHTKHSYLGSCPEGFGSDEAPDALAASPHTHAMLYLKEVPSQGTERQGGNVL